MGRFEDAPEQVVALVNKIRTETFRQLNSAKIKVLYDTKKRMSGGKLVLGRMQKTNDLIKCLVMSETESDIDYILCLDKACFENVEEADRIRLIRRVLQHCDVDFESNNPYKLRQFEIEEWFDEMEYNKDDPRWAERCTAVAESIYSEND